MAYGMVNMRYKVINSEVSIHTQERVVSTGQSRLGKYFRSKFVYASVKQGFGI